VRTQYPLAFPIEALDEITDIVGEGRWYEERAEFARAVWEIEGAAFRIFFGNPEKSVIDVAPIDVNDLRTRLVECHELLEDAKRTMQRQFGDDSRLVDAHEMAFLLRMACDTLKSLRSLKVSV
jgi:hypothetical protein